MINFTDAQGLLTLLIAQADKEPPKGMPLNFILLIIFIVFTYYLMIHIPNKKEQKKRKEQIDSLSKGDKIVTIGGIHGVIAEINPKEDTFALQVDKNTRLTFSRSAISKVFKKKDGAEQAEMIEVTGQK